MLMTETDAPGRRERKKLATRQALHEAAMDLAEERGLANVTVEAITERADVAVRTFFNYFPSKEEAVLQREPDRAEHFRRALAERPASEEPLVALRHVILSDLVLRDLDSTHLLRRMRLISTEPTLLVLMAAHFDELNAGGTAEIARRTGIDAVADPYPSLVVAAAFAACKTSMLRWCEGGGAGDVTAIVGTAFDALASGLTPPTPATPSVRPEATR